MYRICCVLFLLLSITACKKAFNPPAIASKGNYLVVEGQINTGQDSTIIFLSRTVNLSAKVTSKPETNALVTIEDDQNNNYSLIEVAEGKYAIPALNSVNPKQCRLNIKTSDGKTYLSDPLVVKNSPQIDSLGYKVAADGVHIFLNTHDATNQSRYYRWEYKGTWLFHAYYDSYYTLVNGQPVYRTADQRVYDCFNSDTSTTIVLNSSAKLAQDVIYQTPIAFLSSSSEELEDRYSILVKQYVVTPDAFEYYQNLKKNTEQLGTIFDAQPSQLPSNIKCISNPKEPVIGYMTAGTVSQKRIYIDSRTLPAWKPYTFYDKYGCPMDEVGVQSAAQAAYYFGGNPPAYLPLTLPNVASERICVDCTLRGTKTMPAFWQPD